MHIMKRDIKEKEDKSKLEKNLNNSHRYKKNGSSNDINKTSLKNENSIDFEKLPL